MKRITVLLAALGALLLVSASPAFAAGELEFKESFPATVSAAIGLAVNQSNGDLYVIEKSAGAVSRWKPDGTADNFSSLGSNKITGLSFTGGVKESQVAVDSSNGKIYVVSLSENRISIYNENGSSAGHLTAASSGAFGEACGVAVGPEGHVYVADASHHKIDKFGNPPVSGTTEEEISVTGDEPCQIAVGSGPSAGYAFAAGYTSKIFKVKSGFEETIFPTAALTVTVDPVTGYLYAFSGVSIKALDASGTPAEEVSSTSLGGPAYGLAVNGSTGDVYVIPSPGTSISVYSQPEAPAEQSLTVSKSGEGTGEVTSSPSGIDCGATCSASFEEGSTVTLTATPAEGSTFVGWSGACSGGGTCEVTMSEAKSVTAEFASEGGGPVGPPLTTTIEEGSGTVVSNPAGIECTGSAPHSCTTEEIEAGTVTLTASPAAGYAFKSWKGCDKKSGIYGVNGRQCTINLTEERSVSAKFVKVWNLTLENGGGGKVSSKPGGALCLPNCSETTASFAEGKTVEVLSKPNKHFHLVEFGGDCSGTSCTLPSISADHTVSATFAEDTKYALALSKEGGGQALIKTKGPGSVCSYTCSTSTASFYEGETVLVSWKLGKGTSSLTWSTGAGTCTGTHEGAEGSCEVTMSAAKSLVAELE